MPMVLQRTKGVGTAALAVVGIGLLVWAATVPGAPAQPDAPPSKPLVGVVRDPDGRPLAGATVVGGEVLCREPNHRIATTGADGRFELTPGGKSDDFTFVAAYKEGFAPASVLRLDDGDRPEAVELQLARRSPFVGVVKDREGKRVAGAAVRIRGVRYPRPGPDQPVKSAPPGTVPRRDIELPFSGNEPILLHSDETILSGTPLDRIFRATTDAQGRFRFPEMPRGAEVSLVVTAAGMGQYNTRNRQWPDYGFGLRGITAAPAEIVLAPAARVAGRVVTRLPGVKVDGLRVVVGGSREFPGISGTAETDPAGRFEVGGLDEGKANVYLSVHSKELPWTSRTVVDVELKAGGMTEVEIELIQGVRVEGQVLDADSGLPVAGVGVGISDPSGVLNGDDTTDKEGRYHFRLPPGRTVFYICEVPAEYSQSAQAKQTVEVPDIAREFTVPRLEIRKEKREE